MASTIWTLPIVTRSAAGTTAAARSHSSGRRRTLAGTAHTTTATRKAMPKLAVALEKCSAAWPLVS
jgi:hypothetical protein